MNIYLVQIDKFFYDGHGCPDLGGTTFEIRESEKEYDPTKSYDDYDVEIEDDEDEDKSCQDGYNYEEDNFSYKKITLEQSIEYKRILQDYKKLAF